MKLECVRVFSHIPDRFSHPQRVYPQPHQPDPAKEQPRIPLLFISSSSEKVLGTKFEDNFHI